MMRRQAAWRGRAREMRRVLYAIAFGAWMSCVMSCAPEPDTRTPKVGMTLRELALENARVCSDHSGLFPQDLVDGLSMQLIDELRCMDPHWLEYYTPCKEAGCIWAYGAQPLAARPEVLDALRESALDRQDYITIKAAYRDVAMQYYSRWRKENCDSSFPAAVPGKSNHQGGRAVDVKSYDYWSNTLLAHGFVHPLPNDRPHFELEGTQAFRDESESLKSLSIRAFQVLWNKNHPADQIDEDGLYGPQTKQRLGDSPVEGFAVHGCTQPGPDCEETPCAEGCDPAGCANVCELTPCADGCDAQGCTAYCQETPCGEGCDMDGCNDACAQDPCAEGCNPALCPERCEDFPCEEGCDAQACEAFCIRNPCDPACSAEACAHFCEKTPCASVCDDTEACENACGGSFCQTPDPEPCRGADCDDGNVGSGDGDSGGGEGNPLDEPAERRTTRLAPEGCRAAGGPHAPWGGIFALCVLLMGVRERRGAPRGVSER